MEQSHGLASEVIGDPEEWGYLNQGGNHLAFYGRGKWAGYVLKVKKGKKKDSKANETTETSKEAKVQSTEDPLVASVTESSVLSKFLPESVLLFEKVQSQS